MYVSGLALAPTSKEDSLKPVTRDPDDPAFPHGTSAGYLRGCTSKKPCPSKVTCTEGRRRAVNRRELARLRGEASRVPVGPVRQHIKKLIEQVPGATGTHVAEVAGLHTGMWTKLRQNKTCTRQTAAAVLAVTPEALRKTAHFAPTSKVRHLAYTMQALGYPLVWQAQQCGEPWLQQKITRSDRDCLLVERRLHVRMQALADRVGDQPADPKRDGILKSEVAKARTLARRAGWWPPQAYDDAGNLDLRLLPGHPHAEASAHAGRGLEALRFMLDTGLATNEVERRTGFCAHTLLLYRKRMGLVYDRPAVDAPSVLDRDASAAALDRIDRALAEYDAGGDPLYALISIGAVRGAGGGRTVPPDHPSVLRWKAEQQWATAVRMLALTLLWQARQQPVAAAA